MDSSREEIEIDPELSFLEDFVRVAREKGARPYVPKEVCVKCSLSLYHA